MAIVRPRLVDALDMPLSQFSVDFAIPHLQEDLPLYIDPFLMWVSDDPGYRSLHERLLGFFEHIRRLSLEGNEPEAVRLLLGCQERQALGLGYGRATKRGSAIGPEIATSIVRVYQTTPQLRANNLRHIEELQLIVPHLAEDRISDIGGALIADFLFQFSGDRARQHGIPTQRYRLGNVYDDSRRLWIPSPERELPFNPYDQTPLLLVPLNLLRHLPFINYEDYYKSDFSRLVLEPERKGRRVPKEAVLDFNRTHYANVQRYVGIKEGQAAQCRPTPIFDPLSLATLKKKFGELRALEPGQKDSATYEELVSDLLGSLLFPTLEFAKSKSRTIDGVHIRDLIFYNNATNEFFRDIRQRYEARQPVFELKNVRNLETEHVNQLYRYLHDEFGRFGVLVTRNPIPRAVERNIVDLHSAQRVAILCFDDRDLELMTQMRQEGHDPADVVRKKFIEFSRLLPS